MSTVRNQTFTVRYSENDKMVSTCYRGQWKGASRHLNFRKAQISNVFHDGLGDTCSTFLVIG